MAKTTKSTKSKIAHRSAPARTKAAARKSATKTKTTKKK